MEQTRAVYAIPSIPMLINWLMAYWHRELPANDPLEKILGPRVGEVSAWGGPHITILDYTSFGAIDTFRRVIEAILQTVSLPIVRRSGLGLHRGGSQLVLYFESSDLDRCRKAIEIAVEPLIYRIPLADEEFQRARLWIINIGRNVKKNLERLALAKQAYVKAGSPPLQGAFPWRLNALVNYATTEGASEDLDTFLRTGMWPWFGKPGKTHITLASGLKPGEFQIEELEKELWPAIEAKVPAEVCARFIGNYGARSEKKG